MSALHRRATEPHEPETSQHETYEPGPSAPERPLWGEVPPPRPARPPGSARPLHLAAPLDLAVSIAASQRRAPRRDRVRPAGGRPRLALVAPPETSPPEPLGWRPPPRFRDRVLAAVGTPVAVGVVCFAVAVAVAVAIALLQSHAPGEEAVAGSALRAEPASGSAPGGDAPAAASAQPSARVLVHVIGKVRSPGVVELPPGSRVQDAIAAAGGATSRAALSGLNLARPVVDGEQITVTKRGASDRPAQGAPPPAAANDATLDLNTADAAALEQLPRIGPALAQRIVDWRAAHGRFASVEQLLQVSGIGAKTLEGFRDRVRV